MNAFLLRHAGSVTGILSGWDRLRFRGTLRVLASVGGLCKFLKCTGHLFKDFRNYVEQASRTARRESLSVAEQLGRPVEHLIGPSVSKEQRAREIAERDGVKEGLIAALTAVEPCWSFNLRSNRAKGHLQLYSDYRKCLHIYHYQIHPIFGFMHVRVQTWLPFNIHVCLNGREWLSRQLDEAGIAYMRHDNCFTHLADPAAAQARAQRQVSFDWAGEQKKVAAAAQPALSQLTEGCNIEYYWSLDESEWASDVTFANAKELDHLYPAMIRHGIESLGSKQTMRFLGRNVPNEIHKRFNGQVVTDLRTDPRFYEGMRIKHRMDRNSVKMYNKAPNLLRVETTLNNVRQMKSPRLQKGKIVWKQMRKGVADLPRRAEVSQGCNERYLDAMAAVQTPTPLKTLTEKLSRPAQLNGRQVRGLDLLGADDALLLKTVGQGEFIINGLRNRDLQSALFGKPSKDAAEQRRRSGKITRMLRMLRAHGLIQKLPHTHRYQVTEKGRQVIAALSAAREANIHKLAQAA